MQFEKEHKQITELKEKRAELFTEKIRSTELYKAISLNPDFSQDDKIHMLTSKLNAFDNFLFTHNIKQAEKLLTEIEKLVNEIKW